MKSFTVLLLMLLQFNVWAQVKGNKQVITKTFPLETLTDLEINLYADVEVDCAAKEEITITAEENLMDLIDYSVYDGKMKLTQKEWIQPRYKIQIRIGVPNLERVQHSVHETSLVKNIDRESFSGMAIIGTLVLQGKVNTLSASGEIGELDALRLEAKMVNVNLWSHGTIKLGSPEEIKGSVKDDGQVVYSGQPANVKVNTKSGGRIGGASEMAAMDKFDTRFIDLKVRNNSLNRIDCYVKGKKPNGKYFSYGFPMNPGQTRKKNWTVGSKVYRVTNLGTRKLLTVIEASDEAQVVKLYEK